MKVGQKVLYYEDTFVVVANGNKQYNIIAEEFAPMYNIAGVDIKGSTLRTFDTPEGTHIVYSPTGAVVGHAYVPYSKVTALEGQVVSFDAFKDHSSLIM